MVQEATADGRKELASLLWKRQPAMTGTGCPNGLRGNSSQKRSFA